MAADSLVISNIGRIVSGRLDAPIAEGDTIVVRDGRIAAVGRRDEVDRAGLDRVIDADGAEVWPGLIDSHVHVVFGDFTPRQSMLHWIDSCLHGGVTRMVSAGEVHTPGRPKDAAGTKALAILGAKAWRNHRPSGVKILGGALLLEKGLTEEDFVEMAAEGVRHVGEIGISGVYQPEDAAPMARWAQANGMKVLMHVGGASVPGSSVIGAEHVLAIRPDIAVHLNGGPTAAPAEDIERIITQSDVALEVVQCGNVLALQRTVARIVAHDALDRMIIGTDMPSGTGVIPLGMLRTISWVSALGGVAPERAVALATGNTARAFGFDSGTIEPGREADLLIADAPRGSVADDSLAALAIGDTPAISAVLIDGIVQVYRSRNTPPPKRAVRIPWMSPGGH